VRRLGFQMEGSDRCYVLKLVDGQQHFFWMQVR
jgi:hypothetical protein